MNADGIYGVGVPPAGGVGYYAATAVGSAPDVAPIAAVAYVELTDMQDLAIGPSDVYLSQNVPHAGDTLMVYAVIHNNSSRTASGVAVEFRDRQAATTLGISSVNIAIGGTATVAVPWLPAPPDTHDIEVQISPDVLDESNYANNAATRTIVLGLPRAVSHRVGPAGLWLANPYPNPTTDGVAFTFSIPRAAAVSLDAFDLLGRRVWRQQWSSLDAGIHSQQWDGRTSLGSRLPPGVYVCRLTVGEERLQRKFVLKH